jgi:hypothetical protein
MKLLAAILFMAVAAAAQGAKVIQLSPEDAAQAKKLDEAHKLLDQQEAAFRKKIVESYLLTKNEKDGVIQYFGSTDSPPLPGCFAVTTSGLMASVPCGDSESPAQRAKRKREEASRRWIKNGWGEGQFQYSDDFLYIVPADKPVSSSGSLCGGGCIYPATNRNAN